MLVQAVPDKLHEFESYEVAREFDLVVWSIFSGQVKPLATCNTASGLHDYVSDVASYMQRSPSVFLC